MSNIRLPVTKPELQQQKSLLALAASRSACCDVRFTPISGHCRPTVGCPLCAESRHRVGLAVSG
jgi:hypothetical protein